MLGKHSKTASHYLALPLLLILLCIGTNAQAVLIEYKLNLFGPGFIAKYPVSADLQSRGTLVGEFHDGVLSNLSGETPLITITEGYIASGYGQYDNYAYGYFKDTNEVPEFFRDKGIFLDLARGADYEKTIVTENIIREWAWALYIYDENFVNEEQDLKARKDKFSNHSKTIRKQNKTFEKLCYYYGYCDKAGGEFFGDKGTVVPLPAAFYLFFAGIAGLITFSRSRSHA